MKLLQFTTILLLLTFTTSCRSSVKSEKENIASATEEHLTEQDLSKYSKAYFASGCFWCVEAVFESVKGVKEAVSGYSGGSEPNPTYEEVSYGRTHHAEAVMVYYDPEVVSFETLVRVFFGSQDPTTPNRQGPDTGAQYRSIAFFQTKEERDIILNYIEQLEEAGIYKKPIVTEVKEFKKFWIAEDYHQDYEKKHPDNPYVKNVSIPRLRKFQKLYPELLKEELH